MGMIEILSKSLESTIIKEVRKATAHLNPSDLEDEAIGPNGIPSDTQLGLTNPGVTKLIAKKVDKVELNELMKEKSSKADIEMVSR
jgi:hypothetical protein